MPFYSIYIERDGKRTSIPWATTYDLVGMKKIIEDVEANYQGCDFIAADEIGNVYMLTSDWEQIFK